MSRIQTFCINTPTLKCDRIGLGTEDKPVYPKTGDKLA